jgi:hypothetical protein
VLCDEHGTFLVLKIVPIFSSYPEPMSLTKYLFACLLLPLSISAFSQTNDSTVFLKWKLKPNEALLYKTLMEETDTANRVSFSMKGLGKMMGNKGDTTHDADFDKMFKQLSKEVQNTKFETRLTEKRKGIVDIELYVKNDEAKPVKVKDSADKLDLSKMLSGVMLRGSVYEDGPIESFYTKNDQKNLLAIFFELPGKPVKIGDAWPLNIHLISMDQNFTCDSSYNKNSVTLAGIENKNGEHIANLKYDIAEYVEGSFNSPFDNSKVKTIMKMTFQGVGYFSLEKGRWVVYDGVMSLSSTGMMSSKSTQKLSLIPIAN